jgi:prepilin-type N-terminal cleavage/methylation domain-containing protein
MGIRLIHKNQRGFTLIEMLIAVLIAGFVTGGITLTIMHVFNTDASTRNDMIAVYQVRQAGKLVSEDMLQARNVTPGGSLGFPLTLTWIDYGSNYTYQVEYSLDEMPSSESMRLKREYYVKEYGEDEFELESTTIVAEYIDPNQTGIYDQSDNPAVACSFPACGARTYRFRVTATVGGRSETRVYELQPRPGS